MNKTIDELRAALSLAHTVSTSTDDAYMDGVACGIAFCLEQLDEGSTTPARTTINNYSSPWAVKDSTD